MIPSVVKHGDAVPPGLDEAEGEVLVAFKGRLLDETDGRAAVPRGALTARVVVKVKVVG